MKPLDTLTLCVCVSVCTVRLFPPAKCMHNNQDGIYGGNITPHCSAQGAYKII